MILQKIFGRPSADAPKNKKVDSREFYIILEGISKRMVCGYHIRFMCDGLPMSDIASCDSTVPFCFARPTAKNEFLRVLHNLRRYIKADGVQVLHTLYA